MQLIRRIRVLCAWLGSEGDQGINIGDAGVASSVAQIVKKPVDRYGTIIDNDPDRPMVVQVYGEETISALEEASMP